MGYLGSREFVIALAVASLLTVGGMAWAVTGALQVDYDLVRGCDPETPRLGPVFEPLPGTTDIEETDGRLRGTTTFRLDTVPDAGGLLAGCLVVGDLEVRQGDTSTATLVFVAEADPDAKDALESALGGVRAGVQQTGDGTLAIEAAQSLQARDGGVFRGQGTIAVDLIVTLPVNGTWDLSLHVDVGDIDIDDTDTRDLHAMTEVGAIRIDGTTVRGDIELHTDVGRIEVTLDAMDSRNVTAHTDVGRIVFRAPMANGTGYLVEAAADVGSIRLDLGPDAAVAVSHDGPGGEGTGRTAGHETAARQTRMDLRTDVGSIDVTLVPHDAQ